MHIVSVQGSVPEVRKWTAELIALQVSPFLWPQQLYLTPQLHSPSWPVSVPSASCPVPCEWRKAPILADQAALCRTLAFFVGGFPYKRSNIRNISNTGEDMKPGPATGQHDMHLFFGVIVRFQHFH